MYVVANWLSLTDYNDSSWGQELGLFMAVSSACILVRAGHSKNIYWIKWQYLGALKEGVCWDYNFCRKFCRQYMSRALKGGHAFLTQQSYIQEALLLHKEMIIYEGIPRWDVYNREHLETTSMIPWIDYKYNYKSAQ